jgi:hypothetical protein
MVNMADIEFNYMDQDRMPAGYNSVLVGENGILREQAVRADIDDYVVRPKVEMNYNRIRHGKIACTNLNGSPATLGRKPTVGIWHYATEFATAFLELCGVPAFKSQMGAVDPRTLTGIAKAFSRVIETRSIGFQHRINEMNYFLEYIGNFSYCEPKSVASALQFDFINGSPMYSEVRPGSIYSAVALTPVTDFIDIKIPEAKTLIEGLRVYEDISSFLCTKKILENMYNPEAIQEAIGYDRPLKRSDNTAKMLLQRAFSTYGTKSPTINAVKTELDRIGADDFDNWYWPEISTDKAMNYPLFRKFSIHYRLLEEMEPERGLVKGFYLTRYEADTGLDVSDTNGGLTRRTNYKRLRQVTTVSPDIHVHERHDEESFFRQYVQSDSYSAFFEMIQAVRKGEKTIFFDIPVTESLQLMDPNGGGLTKDTFPLDFNTETAASVKAKGLTVEYWPHYDQTGEHAFDEKFTYRQDKYVLGTNPMFVTRNGDFLSEEELLLDRTHASLLTEISLPERGLKLRPERKYYNPLLHTPA